MILLDLRSILRPQRVQAHVDAVPVSNWIRWVVRGYICWSICVDITAAVLLIWYLFK
jgi:hypothetical protein